MAATAWRTLFVAAWLGVALAGCGGGGDDVVTPPPPTVIATTAEAYWNEEPSARWAYVATDARPDYPSTRTNLVTVGSKTVVGGRTVVSFEHSASIEEGAPASEPRSFDGASIYAVLDPQTGFVQEVPAPLLDGVPKTVYDGSFPFPDLDGDGLPETLRLVATVTLGLEASRSVPAGSFSNVLRAKADLTATITGTRIGAVSATSTLTTWYAPQVGVIRREFVDPNYDAPNNVAVEELSGVSVAAVKAGTVPGYVALDAIGRGETSDVPGAPAIASDGTGVLVASRSLASDVPRVDAALLGPDGSVAWTGTALADAGPAASFSYRGAAVFDGANFQVFSVSGAQGALVSRRISTAGVPLGDPAGTPIVQVPGSAPHVAAASDGSSVLVVWQRFDAALGSQVVEGILVGRDGAAASGATAFRIGTVSSTGSGPSVAWSGGRYLVAQDSDSSLLFARVGADGVPLDAGWLPVPGSGAFRTNAQAVAHPDGFFVGWVDWDASPNAGVPRRAVGRRVDANGALLDTADVAVELSSSGDRLGFALAASPAGLFAARTSGAFDLADGAARASATRAPWSAGAPAFAPAGALWYTDTSAPQLQAPFAAATGRGSGFAFAMLENRESASATSDRVLLTFVHPRAAR